MTELYRKYVSEKVMAEELKKYRDFDIALGEGTPIDECPDISRQHDISTAKTILGFAIHTMIFIVMRVSHMLRIRRMQELSAKLRIRTDELSYEPKTCGFHQAYTHLGIARLAQKDLDSAVRSLLTSISIYPCPHSVSFGLSWALRNRLKAYPEAEGAIEKFDVISRAFGGREWYRQHKAS